MNLWPLFIQVDINLTYFFANVAYFCGVIFERIGTIIDVKIVMGNK
jgi:hypothetical protein